MIYYPVFTVFLTELLKKDVTDMEMMKAKLVSLCVYRNMLETAVVKSLLRLCEAKTPEGLLEGYTGLVHQIWQEGHETLSDCIRWHLQYEDSMIGRKIALGQASPAMMDGAAMDIRRLSGIGMLSWGGLKRSIQSACAKLNPEYSAMIANLPELPQGKEFTEEEIFEGYRLRGCGKFALGNAFHWEKGQLSQVPEPDALLPEEMIGYEYQRAAVLENTRILHRGLMTNNVLLYGDSGTGKSATVKSLIHVSEFHNLRIIELAKNSLDELPALVRMLGQHTQKFIVYIDDLSFEREDKGFSALKTALEGGLAPRPQNVAIYATSNRRHLVKESFSERSGDDIHAKETLEERTSLAERFGLRLAYLALDKKRYTQMVLELCHREQLSMTDEEISIEANRWEIQHGGRTPRVAIQLVEQLKGRN